MLLNRAMPSLSCMESPNAKNALFGSSGSGSELRTALDSLEQTITRSQHIATKPPSMALSIMTMLGESGGAIAALLHGGAGLLSTGIVGTAGVMAANNVLSRALTNPRAVRWMAQATRLPSSAAPIALAQLAQMGRAQNDPDLIALAALMQHQQPQTPSP
jgi:hypothetical protein